MWVCGLKNDILVTFSSHTWKSLLPKFPKQPAQFRTRHRITPQLHILHLFWSLQRRDSPYSRTFGGPVSDFPPPAGNRPKTALLKISALLDFSNKILYENETPMKLCKLRCCLPKLADSFPEQSERAPGELARHPCECPQARTAKPPKLQDAYLLAKDNICSAHT